MMKGAHNSMMARLSTTNNPFNPFTEEKEWEQFDEEHGYYTSAYLARVARTSNELSDEDQELIIERAIDEIVKFNVSGLYVKVIAP